MGFRHESAAAWWSLLPWPLLLACATASPAPTSPEAAPDRQYPVEAFGAALRATVAAEAPTTFTASPRPELSIPIGAKKPVTCQLHRGTLSLSQYLRDRKRHSVSQTLCSAGFAVSLGFAWWRYAGLWSFWPLALV